jgi:hypothetical protein
MVRLQGLGQQKNTMTSSGIGPATFRLVAQCLNQLRYRVPRHFDTARDYILQTTITQRLVFSVTVFTALLVNGFQRCSVLDFHVQRLLSTLAVTFQLQLRAELTNTTFRKQRIQQNRCLPATYLRTKTDPIFRTSCPLDYRTIDKIQ